eukprot:261_1
MHVGCGEKRSRCCQTAVPRLLAKQAEALYWLRRRRQPLRCSGSRIHLRSARRSLLESLSDLVHGVVHKSPSSSSAIANLSAVAGRKRARPDESVTSSAAQAPVASQSSQDATAFMKLLCEKQIVYQVVRYAQRLDANVRRLAMRMALYFCHSACDDELVRLQVMVSGRRDELMQHLVSNAELDGSAEVRLLALLALQKFWKGCLSIWSPNSATANILRWQTRATLAGRSCLPAQSLSRGPNTPQFSTSPWRDNTAFADQTCEFWWSATETYPFPWPWPANLTRDPSCWRRATRAPHSSSTRTITRERTFARLAHWAWSFAIMWMPPI